jgi:predicted acylesterase/phospholipase RssA
MQTENRPPQLNVQKKPKVAIAFPGCAGRALACLGILDELAANGIPIDMIAACSSTSIVACAYASGTTDALYKRAQELGLKGFYTLFTPSFKSGMFSLDQVGRELEQITKAKNFEDLKMPITITASDIVSGKEVRLSTGNLSKAVQASCAYPGLFEPVIDGDKVLVDGGLFSVMPIEAAYGMGADIVIGVEMYNERHIFVPFLLKIKEAINSFKNFIGTHIGSVRAFLEEHAENRKFGFFRVLGASIDYAIEENKVPVKFDCDLLIDFDVKSVKKFEFRNTLDIYNQGRIVAHRSIPAIKDILKKGVSQRNVVRTIRTSEHPEYLEAVEELEV